MSDTTNQDDHDQQADELDVDTLRKSWEIDDHWNLRKGFIVANLGKRPLDRLLCLAQMFVNIETLGTCYSAVLMKEVRELSDGVTILDEFRSNKATFENDGMFKPPPKQQQPQRNNWNNDRRDQQQDNWRSRGGGGGHQQAYQQPQHHAAYRQPSYGGGGGGYGQDQHYSRRPPSNQGGGGYGREQEPYSAHSGGQPHRGIQGLPQPNPYGRPPPRYPNVQHQHQQPPSRPIGPAYGMARPSPYQNPVEAAAAYYSSSISAPATNY